MDSKASRTRQFIIEKTAPVFNAKGYAGTSIHDLTLATGLTKGSIYGNFENKDEVALAAFDYNFQQVVVYIKTKMDDEVSCIDKMLVYPQTYRNYLTLPFLSEGCPIANTSTEADDTHPKLKKKAGDAVGFWRDALDNLLTIGIERGEIRPDVNKTEIVSVISGLIQGAVIHVKATGKVQFLNSSMNFLEKMIKELKV
jgi:AcrR family transcriptional regulator